MITKQQVANFVLATLEGSVEAILLRGTDDHARTGGDIDFVVSSGQSVRAAVLIAEAAAASGWGVAGFRQLGYVTQICLIIPGSEVAKDTAIKVDISDGLSWYALGNDLIGDTVFSLRREDFPIEKVAALATFFQKMLYPGYLRERDQTRIFSAISAVEIEAFCRAHGLLVPLAEIELGVLKSSTHWRLRADSANVSGLKLVPWALKAVYSALRGRIGLSTGAGTVIGVAGMDGCGKSTLVDRLVRAVSSSEFTEPVLVHLLPSLIPMPHQILRRHSTVSNYTQPYAEPCVRSWLSKYLRLSYYLIAFAVARIWCSLKRARGSTIVFDRSIIDFASDLTRARIPHIQLPGWMLKMLLPPGFFCYMSAKPETVVKRKGELTLERATDLSNKYLAITNILNLHSLNCETDHNDVFRAFLAEITVEVIGRAKRRTL